MSLFRHLASGRMYRLIFECRKAGAMSSAKQVVYMQLEPSVDKFTGEPIPARTIWTRDRDEFKAKFECLTPKEHASHM